MKRFKVSLLVVVLALGFSVSSYGATEITLDSVSGLFGGDSVLAGYPLKLIFRMTYAPGDGYRIGALSNGFEIYEKNGGNFYPAVGDTIPEFRWGDKVGLGYIIRNFSITGTGRDTVGFGGGCLAGIVDGTTGQAWSFETGSDTDGDTLCIDSAFYPPGGLWWWSTSKVGHPTKNYPPDWYGPHCFHVFECCIGWRGNVDMQGDIDVADLTFLIAYLFQSGSPPACTDEADVDGSGSIDVGDLTYLVAYLFLGGPPPPPCP